MHQAELKDWSSCLAWLSKERGQAQSTRPSLKSEAKLKAQGQARHLVELPALAEQATQAKLEAQG